MEQVSVVHIACFLCRPTQVFICINDHIKFNEFGQMHGQDVFDSKCSDSLKSTTSLVDLLRADYDLLRTFKSGVDLFNCMASLFNLSCENYCLPATVFG